MYDPKDQTALTVLVKYGLVHKVSQSVRKLLGEFNPRLGAADTKLDQHKRYKFVQQCVLACSEDAVECMAAQALRLGLSPMKLNPIGAGTVDDFAQEYVKIASLMILVAEGKITEQEAYEQLKESPVCPLTDRQVGDMFPAGEKWGLGLCLVLCGRPLNVHLGARPGKSGPNQELALRFSLHWYTRTQEYPILRRYTVWFAGGNSCGKDGNTDAAGAFGYRNIVADIRLEYEKLCNMHRMALRKKRHLARKIRVDKSKIAVRNEAHSVRFISFSISRTHSRAS